MVSTKQAPLAADCCLLYSWSLILDLRDLENTVIYTDVTREARRKNPLWIFIYQSDPVGCELLQRAMLPKSIAWYKCSIPASSLISMN